MIHLNEHGFTPSPPPCWLRGRDWGRTAAGAEVRLGGGGRRGRGTGSFGLRRLALLLPFSFAVRAAVGAVGAALLMVGECAIVIQRRRSHFYGIQVSRKVLLHVFRDIPPTTATMYVPKIIDMYRVRPQSAHRKRNNRLNGTYSPMQPVFHFL